VWLELVRTQSSTLSFQFQLLTFNEGHSVHFSKRIQIKQFVFVVVVCLAIQSSPATQLLHSKCSIENTSKCLKDDTSVPRTSSILVISQYIPKRIKRIFNKDSNEFNKKIENIERVLLNE